MWQKTTLAKQFAHGMQYITLDDATALEVARLDAEREPIRLSAQDIKELVAFLGTLCGPLTKAHVR